MTTSSTKPNWRTPKDEGNWRDNLGDELKGNEALANFEDIGQLAQGFIDAKAYQGASVKIPGEDASDEDKKAFNDRLIEKMPNLMYKPDFENADQTQDFYRSLGMPELAEGYAIPEVEVPDGIEIQTERTETFRAIAHKHGLTAAQFKGIMTDVMGEDIKVAQAGQATNVANKAAIKEKFGHAYDDNMAKINTLLTKTNAPPGLVKLAAEGLVDVDTISWLYTMGKQMGGEGFNFDDIEGGGTKTATMTPEEAFAAIDEINNNKDHAYWKGTGEEKKRAIDRMVMLMKFAHPNAATEMPRA